MEANQNPVQENSAQRTQVFGFVKARFPPESRRV